MVTFMKRTHYIEKIFAVYKARSRCDDNGIFCVTAVAVMNGFNAHS